METIESIYLPAVLMNGALVAAVLFFIKYYFQKIQDSINELNHGLNKLTTADAVKDERIMQISEEIKEVKVRLNGLEQEVSRLKK